MLCSFLSRNKQFLLELGNTQVQLSKRLISNGDYGMEKAGFPGSSEARPTLIPSLACNFLQHNSCRWSRRTFFLFPVCRIGTLMKPAGRWFHLSHSSRVTYLCNIILCLVWCHMIANDFGKDGFRAHA